MTTIITHPQSRQYSEGWDRIFGKKTLPQLLQDLGETQAEVASTLKSHGHLGRCHNAHECPVAQYLKSHGIDHPTVTPFTVTAGHWYHPSEEVRPPTHVALFIFAFDRGEYPELIESLNEPEKEQNRT